MTAKIIILDAWKRLQIVGTFVKQYPLGITIDDDRGVRHYATMDRVVSGLPGPQPRTSQQGSLF